MKMELQDGRRLSPERCPLCGKPNGCAMAAGRPAETCWCLNVTVQAEVLERAARLGEQALGCCLCRDCATGKGGAEAMA